MSKLQFLIQKSGGLRTLGLLLLACSGASFGLSYVFRGFPSAILLWVAITHLLFPLDVPSGRNWTVWWSVQHRLQWPLYSAILFSVLSVSSFCLICIFLQADSVQFFSEGLAAIGIWGIVLWLRLLLLAVAGASSSVLALTPLLYMITASFIPSILTPLIQHPILCVLVTGLAYGIFSFIKPRVFQIIQAEEAT